MSAAAFICAFIASAFWQSTLLVVLAALLVRGCRNANATTRYVIWLSVLSASIVLPVATSIVTRPPADAVVPTSNSRHIVQAYVDHAPISEPVPSHSMTQTLERDTMLTRIRTSYTLPSMLGAVISAAWLTVAALLILRLVAGLLHIERLKRDSRPLDPERSVQLADWNRAKLGVREVSVRVSERTVVPLAVGLFEPTIILPNDLERQLDAADLNRILLHELAHVRRHDDWTNALAQLTGSLLFFSPAVAYALAQLDIEREIACDDAVLENGREVLAYATTLARVAENVASPHRGLAALGIFRTRRAMLLRIERILEDGRDVRAHVARVPAALACAAIAVVSLTGTIAPSITLRPMETRTMSQAPFDAARPAELLYSGTWELKHANTRLAKGHADGVQLDLRYPSGFSNWSTSADLTALGIDPRRFRGARAHLTFAIKRDAGTFECRGDAGDGMGQGTFRFQPDSAYAAEYARLGLKLSLPDQVIAGMANMSLDYTRELASIGIRPMSFQNLISIQMSGVSLDHVRSIHRDFPNAAPFDIVSFTMMMRDRLHDSHSLHVFFPDATLDDVMRMGMAGVTPDYIAMLRSADVRWLSASNVTALRSAGVDEAFIKRMIAHGKTGRTIDEVVALKNQGF